MKDHMIRLKDNTYNKLYENWLYLRRKYGHKYTINEIIDIALETLEIQNELYERGEKYVNK